MEKTIKFEKSINGKTVVVTGISDGKHSLDIDTFYIKKLPPQQLMQYTLTITSKTSCGASQSLIMIYFNIEASAANVNRPNDPEMQTKNEINLTRANDAAETASKVYSSGVEVGPVPTASGAASGLINNSISSFGEKSTFLI